MTAHTFTAAKIIEAKIGARLSPLRRFELQTIPEPNSGCWLWLGQANRRHRPYLCVDGKKVLASRFSYQAFKGPIVDGLWVLHTCHTTWCVNPDHLYIGTPRENTQDMFRAGRHFSQRDPAHARARAFHMHAVRKAKMYCRRGHELSGDNLRVHHGSRYCKACCRINQANFRQRRQAVQS
jgi:hypothetical protein